MLGPDNLEFLASVSGISVTLNTETGVHAYQC